MKSLLNFKNFFIILFGISVLIPIVLLSDQSRYFLNPHAFGPLLASYCVGVLGIIAAERKLEKEERYYFLFVTLSIFFWLWTLALGEFSRYGNESIAINWFRLGSCGPILIPTNIYAFSVHFLGLKRKKMLIGGNILAALFIVLSYTTSYFLVGVHYYTPWGYFPKWEFIRTIPYFMYFSVYMGLAQAEYWKALKFAQHQRIRNQISYLFTAFNISYLGAIDFLPTFGYRVYPFGYLAIFGWWSVLAYAILKHGLMDITVILRKTIVYSVVTGTLTIVYLGTVALFTRVFEGFAGAQTVFSSAVAAGLITVCFQPLRKKVQSFVDRKFFRQYVDREEKLYELSRDVITHTTSEEMSEALLRVIADTIHPKAAVLYLRQNNGNGFFGAASIGEFSGDRMEEGNPLQIYFIGHPQPFVQELTAEIAQSHDTRRIIERAKGVA